MSSKSSKGRFRKYILFFWTGLLALVLLFVIYMVGLSKWGNLPDFEVLENPSLQLATEVYTADGELLGKYYSENRSNVRYPDMPAFLVDALISTEDVRFRNHSGVDLRALGRVLYNTLLRGNSSSGGGSTLTQQLAKNLFGRQENMSKIDLAQIKFKEWITATKLERSYTKDEILTMYLNTVPFIYGAYGVQSASRTFFGKDVSDLKIEEAATLVGMLKNPSLYNPIRRTDTVRHRRNVVFSQMTKYGYMDRPTFDSLKTLELDVSKFHRQDHNTGSATYFREQLRQWLKTWCSENEKPGGGNWDIYRDGLKVYTTIDSRIQMHAESSMREWMGQLQKEFNKQWGKGYRYDPWTYPYSDRRDPEFINKKIRQSDRYKKMVAQGTPQDSIELVFNTPIEMTVFNWQGENYQTDTLLSPRDSIKYMRKILQAGFMAMDPETGYIRAWVGGIDHRYFKYDHVNKNAKRQVGSTFKPFVYATAIKEKSFSPCYEVPNVPVTFSKDDKRWDLLEDWTPRNSGDEFAGEMVPLETGLANSINTITAFLMKEVGIQPVIDLAKSMGISSDIPVQPSICLGTPEISLIEMVGSYTVFDNRGQYTHPFFVSRIEDKNGVELYSNAPMNREVMSEEEAYVMLKMLQNVVHNGTGQRIHRAPYGAIPWDCEMAGKTGTTQQHSDGWFMGVVPKLIAGTWVGADDPVVAFRSIAYGQGANMALPIYGNFIRRVFADDSLDIKVDDRFPPLSTPATIELDCSKYHQDRDNPYDELFE